MLSVEPWGMKHTQITRSAILHIGFSALGRAVGDETSSACWTPARGKAVSVLSVEPWGMKQKWMAGVKKLLVGFSALGRAVGDETGKRIKPPIRG